MTPTEARILKRLIREKTDVQGNCKMFSVALGKVDACHCALCQIDEMDLGRLVDEVTYLIRAGYTGLEDRRSLSDAIPKEISEEANIAL